MRVAIGGRGDAIEKENDNDNIALTALIPICFLINIVNILFHKRACVCACICFFFFYSYCISGKSRTDVGIHLLSPQICCEPAKRKKVSTNGCVHHLISLMYFLVYFFAVWFFFVVSVSLSIFNFNKLHCHELIRCFVFVCVFSLFVYIDEPFRFSFYLHFCYGFRFISSFSYCVGECFCCRCCCSLKMSSCFEVHSIYASLNKLCTASFST